MTELHNTVKSWKQRHGLSREKGAHKQGDAPKGNKDAVRNGCGPGGSLEEKNPPN